MLLFVWCVLCSVQWWFEADVTMLHGIAMQETVDHLIANTSVLSCKRWYMEAINEGELKLSASILKRGWNIASMSIATRGWDFRRKGPISCNGGVVCLWSRAVVVGEVTDLCVAGPHG